MRWFTLNCPSVCGSVWYNCVLYCPDEGSYTKAEEYIWPCAGASVDAAGLSILSLDSAFVTGAGLEEMILLSCWNLWNSASKLTFPLLFETDDGVDETKDLDGVINCLV